LPELFVAVSVPNVKKVEEGVVLLKNPEVAVGVAVVFKYNACVLPVDT
jgi:hypothetical protein